MPGIVSERPRIARDVLVLYVVQATPTSGNNVVKPLMLIECLQIPHHVEVVSCQTDLWFAHINPLKMVPAIEDAEATDGSRATVFESSACLRYIADKYDKEGTFSGKSDWEKAQVSSWLAMHNAALSGHAKWWLTLKKDHEKDVGGALDIIKQAILKQYGILDDRLSRPGQNFIALADRATIADFATLAFANKFVASVARIDISEFPRLSIWSENMFELEGVKRAYERVKTFGIKDTCNCSV